MARASSLNFKTMTIRFNGEIAPLVVRNQAVDVGSGVELYELVNGQESFSPLRWTDGSTKVFFGTVLATKEVDLTVSFVCCRMRMILKLKPIAGRFDHTRAERRRLESRASPSTSSRAVT